MTGNIKTLAAYLAISLAVLGTASDRAASGAGGHDSDQGGNGGDVHISRGHIGGRMSDGDSVGDAYTNEFGTVARPKTITTGTGTARTIDGMGAETGVTIVHRSLGSPDFGRASVANLRQAGLNNGGLGLQGTAYGQDRSAPNAGAARVDGTNLAPEGVYNQFGIGVTAAALNSADPFNRSLHENRPNMINADSYNNQFVHWSYGLSSYYGGYGTYGGYGPYENGYSPFVYDSLLYDRRGSSSNNPYQNYARDISGEFAYPSFTRVVVQPAVYEYSQTLTTRAAAPAPMVDDGHARFDVARNAFKAGDYSNALELTDRAIYRMPSDMTLHEFRGLVLFALHRYEDAAASLHATRSGGPGWDWRTFVGLYPNVSVYTEQLRALENYCNLNPQSAAARFDLAYLYLTQGNTEVAVDQFKQAVALRPQDAVAARLIQQLEKTSAPAVGDGVRPQ